MRRWMLVGMLTVCSVAMGQVAGRLEGWFVTDEGVPFFMAVNAPTERIALRPVWGHYALTLSIQAPAPMREVTVFNRGGKRFGGKSSCPHSERSPSRPIPSCLCGFTLPTVSLSASWQPSPMDGNGRIP